MIGTNYSNVRNNLKK